MTYKHHEDKLLNEKKCRARKKYKKELNTFKNYLNSLLN
jgi:hypothetical protein